MPGTKHHTDKWRRCVDEVVGKGHDQSSASAICTTSLQNAGEPIYMNAQEHDEVRMLESAEPRELHLCGATGQVRYDTLNGRRHLVVPVVALMEGVIHPVNAQTPEFVSAAVLEKAAASWIGKPVTLGHPKKNGTQCSASEPAIRKSAGIGVIMASTFTGKRLLQEAWIDEEKAKALHPVLYETLTNGGREEVSVGAFVVTDPRGGDFNGKPFKASWLETQGDHLAFLPGGRGACSCNMGCGTHRAAAAPMHLVTASGFEPRSLEEHMVVDLPGTLIFSALSGDSLDERINEVRRAVEAKYSTGNTAPVSPTGYAYPQAVFDDYVIVSKDGELFSVDYSVDGEGEVTLGDVMTKVEQRYVPAAFGAAAMKMADCPTCNGVGQVKDGTKQKDCPMCDGEGKVQMKAAAGARHSGNDMKMIQTVHDHAAALGATCDRKNLETAQAISPEPTLRESTLRVAMRREGTKWVLYSTHGNRRLALHDTEAEAREQQQAMEALLSRT